MANTPSGPCPTCGRAQRRRINAPKPDALAVALWDLRQSVPQVLENYRWMFDLGYERTTRDQERVHQSSVVDEPASIVASSQKKLVRDRVRLAATLIAQAAAAMKGADAALSRAATVMDEGTEHSPGAGFSKETLKPDELKAAQEAKARRTARNEGWGQS